jgi:hypothetical protein
LAAANLDPKAADSGTAGAGQGSRRDMKYWGPAGRDRVVKATENKRSYLLAIDQSAAPGFGDFLLANMNRLFGEYRAEQDMAGARGRGGKPTERADLSTAKDREH